MHEKVIEKRLYLYNCKDYKEFKRILDDCSCRICGKTIHDYEEIAVIDWSGRHFCHSECVDHWFNTQKHINCPDCLEYVLSAKTPNKYLKS